MMAFKFPVVVVGLLAVGFASALPARNQAPCAWTCGSVCYEQIDINKALGRGFSLFEAEESVGSGNYPHRYNNREKFDFPTAAPWYEFPILANDKIYSGGSPGPDRVIFNGKGVFTYLITHTGASGNNFVACREN